jgi:FtsP/CotA-like multicopper oxidase with cupredoxin domain
MNRLMRRRPLVMRAPTKKRTGAIGLAALAAALLAAMSGGSASAATVTINLCAVPTTLSLPNAPVRTLSGAIGAADTTITPSSFITTTGNFDVLIDGELIEVVKQDAATGNWTVVRGQPGGAMAAAHSGGATMTQVLPTWEFADGGAGAQPVCDSTITPSLPGPELGGALDPYPVTEGDTVTINVTNSLPAPSGSNMDHIVTLEIPGLRATSVPPGAGPGQTATWTFVADNPGTYLYQSSGDAGRQVGMGLFGALIVNSNTPLHAYDDNVNQNSTYTDQKTLVLSEYDPAFNADPDHFVYTTGDYTTGFRATYWLINGQPYNGTPSPITHPNGSRLLLRFLNAGYDNTSMTLLGIHDTVVGRSGTALNNPILANNETIPAGGSEDAIIDFTGAGTPPTTNGFPLFNRDLHVTNGQVTTAHSDQLTTDGGGGMMTFVAP